MAERLATRYRTALVTGASTGLGLAIVKHLVEAHGGKVRAESVPGAGTTIVANFPAGR